MSAIQADYFDGRSSAKHPVSIVIVGGRLQLAGHDVRKEYEARAVRIPGRVANTPRWLYLPDGAACVTPDNDAIDRLSPKPWFARVIHRWESRPAYATLAVALVVASLWLLVDQVLPAAVSRLARHIPLEAEAALGRQTLAGMEQYFLKPSRLAPQRQAALREKFDRLVKTANEPPRRLEFRASPLIGANAFALPSGIIVVTDEMVALARNDNEILAVLAHELGHVHHRHTMRRLLESSLTVLVIAGVTGDIASTTSLAAAAPAVLLHNKYSRDAEREADRYAIDLLAKAAIPARHFAAFLARLEANAPKAGAFPTFLSSHPATDERKALALSAPAGAPAEDAHPAGEGKPEPAKLRPKFSVVAPEERRILALLETRDYAGLEKLLGGLQHAFEQDPGTSRQLENAFRVFRYVPAGLENHLNEWIQVQPSSYAAHVARAGFYVSEGIEARGARYISETSAQSIQEMRDYFRKATVDLQRSLGLTQKPYLSHRYLMTVNRYGGSRAAVKKHFIEAVKLAPASVGARLAYMTNLEPRWGGSYAEMEALVAQTRSALADPKDRARLAARIPAYRGFERQRAKDYPGALRNFDEAIGLHADSGTLCERAYVLSQLGRAKEAFDDVRTALTKTREERYCLLLAPSLARRVDDANEAIRVLSMVIEIDPRSSAALNGRGWRYQNLNKPHLAFDDYLASAKLDDAWAQMQTGKFLWHGIGVSRNQKEALVWLRKAADQGEPNAKLSLQQALQALGGKEP